MELWDKNHHLYIIIIVQCQLHIWVDIFVNKQNNL